MTLEAIQQYSFQTSRKVFLVRQASFGGHPEFHRKCTLQIQKKFHNTAVIAVMRSAVSTLKNDAEGGVLAVISKSCLCCNELGDWGTECHQPVSEELDPTGRTGHSLSLESVRLPAQVTCGHIFFLSVNVIIHFTPVKVQSIFSVSFNLLLGPKLFT